MRAFWCGNFFPTCAPGTSWMPTNGAVRRQERLYPVSELRTNRAYVCLRAKTYRKRTGMVRPRHHYSSGEGYSIMWEEGKERSFARGTRCSMVTPLTNGSPAFQRRRRQWRDTLHFIRRCSSTAMRRKSKTGPKTRSNIRTRSLYSSEVRRGTGQAGHQEHYAR